MNDWTQRNRRIPQPTADEQEPEPEPIPAAGSGLVPGVAGVLLCVLLIMAVGVIVAQFVGAGRAQPGPGATVIAAHVAAAVAGLFCYRFSRRVGPQRLLGLAAIVLVTVLLLWFFWWSPTQY